MKRSNRTEVFQVRFTTQEKRDFLMLAAKRNTNLAEVIRQILHREVDDAKRTIPERTEKVA